ncbi:MAG: extracellular solute-binding protein [Opitutales bacterium]|nr:extracellular solute-binding protein [Opitutales bacterium]
MSDTITNLRGIAWNHTRGFVSVVATAQRFEELNPHIRILWEKRSLQAFADAPMEKLADAYDLIVMDHPHTALAAKAGLLLPLDEHLPSAYLDDQAENSVGASHRSYNFNGHQWSLATDAATPVATWREDLLRNRGIDLPATWDDVLELADAGHVGAALFPVDVLMNTYMFCKALGAEPFADESSVAPTEILESALEHLRELARRIDPVYLELNPIRTAERMTLTDTAAYCPFAYSYSNYSRPGYARRTLKAGGLVRLGDTALRSTLGGAGLAVSSRTKHAEEAAAYTAFTGEPETQRGIYFTSGGQPGHRSAWLDDSVNAASNGFFRDTLDTLDTALLRPAYPGYMHFQDNASPVAHAALAGTTSISDAARELQEIYRRSRAL